MSLYKIHWKKSSDVSRVNRLIEHSSAVSRVDKLIEHSSDSKKKISQRIIWFQVFPEFESPISSLMINSVWKSESENRFILENFLFGIKHI